MVVGAWCDPAKLKRQTLYEGSNCHRIKVKSSPKFYDHYQLRPLADRARHFTGGVSEKLNVLSLAVLGNLQTQVRTEITKVSLH